MTTPPTRAQLEPHLRSLLQDDPEHLRLTAALASAREALGPTIPSEVLALLDASTDLTVHVSSVEARLMWSAGKAYGGATALDTHWRAREGGVATRRGVASLLGGDQDPVELALRMAMEAMRAPSP